MSAARPADGRALRALTFLLAATAGGVDAVGFLSFEEVFVSFMSGNTTQLGVAAGLGDTRGAASSALPVVLYVAGSCAGALVALRARRRAFRAVLLLETLLLVGAATLPGAGNEAAPGFALLVLAMGVQNAALNRTPAGNVGVTYVTGTLAKIGRLVAARLGGSREAGREAGGLARLWLCFALGGAVGAFAHARLGFGALWGPILVLALLVLWNTFAPGVLEERADAV